MDHLRKLWMGEGKQAYEPLASGSPESSQYLDSRPKKPIFSWIEYTIFLLLGISMLWAWNMFLAAGPYFQNRFKSSAWISENFQAAEISVSTLTNLGSMLILTRLQTAASYPKIIVASLLINMVVFTLLAASTSIRMGAVGYFAFLMTMIFATSLATGLCQNGIFAYVSGFGEAKYTQGIMTGQAVAGVLPCIAQIVSVLFVQASDNDHHDGAPPLEGPSPVRSSAALAYFLTATVISVATLLAFSYLAARHRKPPQTPDSTTPDPLADTTERTAVPILTLFRKLFWLASAVFLTFAVTMVFPVYTQRILSVQPPDQQSPLLQPQSFVPLAFLLWNIGDLLGRLLTAVPSITLEHSPRVVFVLAIARVGFVGLYHLCNIRGQGAVVNSDFFYLVVVQLLFGLTNGYLGSTCMIGAGAWVDAEEREAAGGFMGLCLVAGLAVGSLLSFFVAA